jgi:hypothetical protein
MDELRAVSNMILWKRERVGLPKRMYHVPYVGSIVGVDNDEEGRRADSVASSCDKRSWVCVEEVVLWLRGDGIAS